MSNEIGTPVLYFALDSVESGVVKDANGNGLEGTVHGAPQVVSDDTFGTCLRLDGADDYIQVEDSPELGITTYTVSIWIKPEGVPDQEWKGIIGKGTLPRARHFNIWIHNSGYIHHRFNSENDANAGPPDTPAGVVSWNEWNHLVITHDGTTARTYVNGIEQAGGPVDAPVALAVNLYIGRNLEGSSGNNFKGLMSNVRIYDYALTADQIEQIGDEDTGATPKPDAWALYGEAVGIGTRELDGHQLKVEGASAFDGNVAIEPPSSLDFGMQGRQMLNLWKEEYGIGIQHSTQYFRTGKNFAWFLGGSHDNDQLDAGGGATQMVINERNVGIGTTTPNARLEIFNDDETIPTVNFKTSKGDHDSHAHWGQLGDWYIRSANPAGKIVIQDTGGNVGIGTGEPAEKLTVYDGNLSLQTNNNSEDQSVLYQNSGGFYTWRLYRTNAGSNRAHFRIAGGLDEDFNQLTDYFAIDKDGNVGVGTNEPTQKLHVNGATHLEGNVTVGAPSTLSFGAQVRQMINLWEDDYGIGVQSSTQYFRTAKNFAWYQGGEHQDDQLNAGGGVVQMVINNNNVGIGTGTPTARLEISNNDASLPTANFISAKGERQSHIHWGEKGDWYIRSADAEGKVVMQDNGGHVGIGTSTPTAPLHVVGETNLEGNIKVAHSAALNFGSQVRQMINLWQEAYGIGVQNNTQYFRTAKHFAWYQGGEHKNNQLNPGETGKVQMVIRNDKVGIGLDDPKAKLHVAGAIRVDGDIVKTNAAGITVGGTQNAARVRIGELWGEAGVFGKKGLTLGSNKGYVQFGGKDTPGVLRIWARNNEYWQISTDANDRGDKDLFFDFSGNPSNFVSGWLEPMGGGWKRGSDQRLKDEIEPLSNTLETVMKLQPCSYTWKANPQSARTIGFVAQEVESVFPELVHERRGYKGLDYSDFSVLAIAALQEQQKQIDELKETVAGLSGHSAN